MAEVLLSAEGLGKKYRLGSDAALHTSVREAITAAWSRAIGRSQPAADDARTIWALQDVSFEVRRGERLGIVGRNGAGKSTLLKLVSRLTEPTRGRLRGRGRLGTLLEIGTGFHPELSGRENIYLSGAVMGMKRAEIVRRFDEIVAFSEMERFLDTPVKRYSSGMYVRLAFAVAAHLEPDILVVDEVLAVGDINFQRKCLGRMAEVAGEGRTVLFVSHNMAAIKQLCSRAILLEEGRVLADGDPNETIASYANAMSISPVGSRRRAAPLPGAGVAWISEAKLFDSTGGEAAQLYFSEPFTVHVVIEAETAMNDAILEVGISTADGLRVATLANTDAGGKHLVLEPGVQSVDVQIDMALLPGTGYAIDLAVHRSASGFVVDSAERILSFAVINVARNSSDHYPWDQVRGYVRPQALWSPVVPSPGSLRD